MNQVLPPGEDPRDPAVKEIDAIAFALNQTRTHLRWIDEHRATFEATCISNPEEAEREMGHLKHSTIEALLHINRLAELLLSGHAIDPSKRLPRDLQRLRESFEVSSGESQRPKV